jgi:anti-anti-sigma regulatory factor
MPPDPPGTFSISVTIGPARCVHLALSGEVDLAARRLLAYAVDHIADASPDAIVVDLAAVTFAGTALVNFLASIRLAVPAGSALVACCPTPAANYVLTRTDAAEIATIRTDICAQQQPTVRPTAALPVGHR